MLYIKDQIKPVEYENFWDRDMYLQAPTGSGKTTFILEKILPMAMKQNRGILILCNRSNLVEQYGRDLSKINVNKLRDGDFSLHRFMQADMIALRTYHALIRETDLDRIIQRIGIIVCDEIHALYSDSQFATGLYVAFQKLACWRKGRFMLHVTATGDRIFPLLHSASEEKPTILYHTVSNEGSIHNFPGLHRVEPDYSYLSIRYLHNLDQIPSIVAEDSDPESKWMIFVSSVTEGEKIELGLQKVGIQDCFFLKKENARSQDGQELNAKMTDEHTFSCRVLISTIVLETGVSIHEDKVRNIVDLQYSKDAFLQVLGRKRMQEGETLNLFIMTRSRKFFASKANFSNCILREACKIQGLRGWGECQEYIAQKLLQQSGVDVISSFVFYKDGFRVNPIAVEKAKNDHMFYRTVGEQLREDDAAFIKTQLSWLGLEESYSPENWVDDTKTEDCRKRLMGEFEKLVGTEPMTLKEFSTVKSELAAILHTFFPTQVRRDRALSTAKVCAILKKMQLPYAIVEVRDDRKKNYQIVRK